MNRQQGAGSFHVRIALILRGALAMPSGNDDDPYHRLILASEAGSAATSTATHARPVLRLPPLNDTDSDEQIRKTVKDALTAYHSRYSALPALIELEDGARCFVHSDADDEDGHPLRNKVALVTGAAGAIGSGICTALLEKGCRVAAADLPGDHLQSFIDEISATAGDRILGVPMDVTSSDDVERGFDSMVTAWGGVDIVVVNAGIPLVAPLTEMDMEAFRRLETVNVEGTLLTLAEAGRRMRTQGTGGDIILISTKNVFAPGASFGAYSATKAAAHQLARIASLEFAEYGIRVNMVAPDAVFGEGRRKSGLWAQIGPDRMRARGLDEKGLEDYYRDRNLLKARVTAAHVANAVLFFATRQTPTTGATIPVDGGLPDATPR